MYINKYHYICIYSHKHVFVSVVTRAGRAVTCIAAVLGTLSIALPIRSHFDYVFSIRADPITPCVTLSHFVSFCLCVDSFSIFHIVNLLSHVLFVV